MSNARVTIILAILATVVLMPLMGQAKEIRFDETRCYSGAHTIVSRSKTLTVTGWEFTGIVQSHLEDKTFHGSTFHCMGTMKVMPGTRAVNGYCKYMGQDGDIMVGELSARQEGSTPYRGTWTVLQGTGKWEGITGGGTAQRLVTGKPITQDAIHGCGRYTGTYNLPE